ncbi:Small GTPase superfamily, Rab type [Parasponia andersonii]|uniref:Small GTPase superfamily, Rab type n=1 Tax=Parasponia andersonii TaxID=3476 RepID=A0A2P5AHT6_PARAD|nr:Small GTPase superfamily, Rab type [Parasponia andersonii]
MSSYDYNFKYIIVSDTCVGQYCLLLQFNDLSVGAEFGRRRRRPSHQDPDLGHRGARNVAVHHSRSYYRGAAGVVLLVPNTTIMLAIVGNKCDHFGRRAVSKEQGEQFAKENGVLFLEASARSARNFEEAFTKTAANFFKIIQDDVFDVSK